MSNLDSPTFKGIMQSSGRVPTVCNCERCKAQCHTPCLGTPEDIERLIDAGYGNRLTLVWWCAGMIMGVTDTPIKMDRLDWKITDGVLSTITACVNSTTKD